VTELIPELEVPQAPAGTGAVHLGMGVPRVDGRAKVTGTARYAAEHPADDLVIGVVVNATIARGRITSIDTARARAVPGVLDVLTHEHRPRIRSLRYLHKDMTAPGGSPFKPLHDDRIVCSGQPIALVLAESFEIASHAAHLVRVDYQVEEHATDLLAQLPEARMPKPAKVGYSPPPAEKGDAEAAFDAAPFRVDARFHSAVEHHNPMELFATTVRRDDDGHLTIYDKTQSSINSRWYVSHVFGLSKKRVTVRNPYVGGAFGAGLRPQHQLPLAVMGALHLERSVRVVLTRPQMFTFGHRPEIAQRVRVAADRDGCLQAVLHEAVTETSRFEDYVDVVVNWAGELYPCDAVKLEHRVVELDRFSPIDMRAPGAAHGVYALEIAMDELAHELGMDPLELRLRNYAERSPADDLPFSSKELRACYQQGAAAFGWDDRPPAPRSRREGTEWVGWGMATGIWDALQMAARASAELHVDGSLVVSSAASDIGTGTYTVMSQIAAATMGLPLEQVRFQLGDSTLPMAPVEGGSSHVTTVGSAVEGVCLKLQKRLVALAKSSPRTTLAGARLRDVEFVDGTVRLIGSPVTAMRLADVLADAEESAVAATYSLLPNMKERRRHASATHSAVFCEVRVDDELGTVRVTRVVSAIAAGRIINATTARSQIIGGVVWGIGQALHEESQMDHRLGRFMNHDLAEYHLSVNADVHDVEVIFVEEDDRVVSQLGAKGVGEIGIIGVPAAISNAIFHATGRRVRDTPMTLEHVMRPEADG
jgi:xanthine dehydrogenase YagR molybdenum-binding subunit